MTPDAIVLLSLLLVGHFLGDFTPLATRTMQEAKAGVRPPGPIVTHAAVHGLLVLAAVAVVRPVWGLLLGAAVVEFATHLLFDWTKMRLGARFPTLQDPADGSFWRVHGLDQLAHGLVLVAIAAWVL